jgi:protein involved in polysaccharide export with SLBB domain
MTDMTVFKALINAGGVTKWGSEDRVKILRKASNASGLETIKVDINSVIKGDANSDIKLQSGDIIIVSKGIF